MRLRLAGVGAAVLAAVVGLAGCSSGTPASPGGGNGTAGGADASGASGKTTVTIGVGGGTYGAALTTDAFAANGLQLVQKQVNSGAAAIPLLLNGQLQFTAADSVGALTAISKKVPLVIVAMAATGGSSAETDATAVMVKGDSALRSAHDLEGKKVAVNGIGNTAQLSAAAAIDKLGGDSTKVKFVETPPTTMNAAVANGTIDAAVLSEPGIAQGKALGLRSLLSPVSEALPAAPLFVYVTSQSYLDQHRDVVDKFARAMASANTYCAQHPQFVRDFAAKVQKMAPADAATFTLPVFDPPTVQKPALQKVLDLMVKYKTISAPVDVDKAIYTP